MTSIRMIEKNPYGPLDKKKLRSFEGLIGIDPPADYRDFFIEFNCGKPEHGFFGLVEINDGTEVENFYGLHDGPDPFCIETFAGTNRHGIPHHLVAIGDDGVGNYICLGIASDLEGKIFFLDHELHPFDDLESMEGVSKIADSFSEFLYSLQIAP